VAALALSVVEATMQRRRGDLDHVPAVVRTDLTCVRRASIAELRCTGRAARSPTRGRGGGDSKDERRDDQNHPFVWTARPDVVMR